MRVQVAANPSAEAARLVGAPVRTIGIALGGLRCLIGAVMIGDPPRLARLLGVDSVTARRTGWLTMMIGAREVALGAGSLYTLGRGGSGQHGYAAQALTDAGDAFALVTAVRARRISTTIGVAVAASAAAGAALNLAAARAAGRER